MTDATQIQLIVSLTTLASTVVTAVVAVITHTGMKEVKHATNSIKDELVQATKIASRAEGVVAGREEAKAEQRAENISGQPPPAGPTSQI